MGEDENMCYVQDKHAQNSAEDHTCLQTKGCTKSTAVFHGLHPSGSDDGQKVVKSFSHDYSLLSTSREHSPKKCGDHRHNT